MRRLVCALGLAAACTCVGMIPTADALAAAAGSSDGAAVPANATAPANSVSSSAIVQTALRYLGYPYTTVGNSPSQGFSCIGFVSYVYKSNGIPLPDDLSLAFNYSPAVSFSSLLPGDILFFQNTVWPGLSHAAIYLGGGRFVHAEWYNRGVVISSFNNDPVDGNYWIGKYLGANRPWGGAPGSTVTPPVGSGSSGGSAGPTITPASEKGARVVVAALNVRSAPSRASQVLQVIVKGTPVSVIAAGSGWDRIQLSDRTSGWVVTAGISVPSASSVASTPKPAALPAKVQSKPLLMYATAIVPVIALRVHTEPSIGAHVITVIRHGQRVEILDGISGWIRIRLASGITGWVSAPYLGVQAPKVTATQKHTVTAPVRVHTTPGIKAPVITVAPAGTSVQVLGAQSSWILVQLPSHITGFVFGSYVR